MAWKEDPSMTYSCANLQAMMAGQHLNIYQKQLAHHEYTKLVELIQEARDTLVLCSLLDKSGQANAIVELLDSTGVVKT